jgi:hypothetical protein
MSADVGKIEGPTAAADILSGFQTFAATTAATTLITIPAGRTWVGTISVSVACQNAAANAATAQATGVVTTAGAGVTPAAGSYFRCDALAGANVAAGLVGDSGDNFLSSPFTVAAPVGNSVTVQVAATVSGSSGQVSASAIGALQ